MFFCRYKKISFAKDALSWKDDKEIILITHIILVIFVLFWIIVMFINTYFDLQIFPMYDSCMNRAGQPSFIQYCFLLVTLATLLLTIGYDIALLRLVRIWKRERIPSSRMDNIEDRNILHEPPMRNTIINMLSIVNVSAVVILARDKEVTLTSKYASVFTAVLSAMVFKGPIIIFWTLKVNESNERRDQMEERERLRQIEIQQAKQRMSQLRTINCQPPIEVNEQTMKVMGPPGLLRHPKDLAILELKKPLSPILENGNYL